MRGFGRGQGHKNRRLQKQRPKGFLQPCLLMQLCTQDRHGYELLQGLQGFIADAQTYDPSIIYRIMRGMEQSGWVVSYEGSVSHGPRRRIYRLTQSGKKQLAHWIEDIKQSRAEIDHLLAMYERQMENP